MNLCNLDRTESKFLLFKINPLTNCVVDARFEAAKEDARRVDAEIAAAVSSSIGADSLFKERPLLGIPFTAKDCFNVKGLSWEDFQMTSFILQETIFVK